MVTPSPKLNIKNNYSMKNEFLSIKIGHPEEAKRATIAFAAASIALR